MNLALLDPFILAQDFPDTLSGSLRSGHACSLRFNRRGDYLAAGRVDGTVVIWDMDTYGVARKLRGHTRSVQSLSWSRDGRYLLSASQDWKCILWDLKDGSRAREVKFEAPVFIADLHPYNPWLFVAALYEEDPFLVDISEPKPVKYRLPTAPLRREPPTEGNNTASKPVAQSTCVAIFTALGNHILSGTSKGLINIIETESREMIHSERLCNGLAVFLRFTPNGRDLLINSSDRVIRTLHMPDLSSPDLDPINLKFEVEHKFQDLVNRLSWNDVAFSATGEYVTASTFMNHDIYIWERSVGSLVKILEGPKEELGPIEWHPRNPLVAACGLETGCIYTWSIQTPQKWSALAPDFQEVEENVEYVEREDEFDIHAEEELKQRRLDEEDEEVDVLTIEPTKGEEDDVDQFMMPVLLDIEHSDDEDDLIAVGVGTMRRKDPTEGRGWATEAETAEDGGRRTAATAVATNGPKTSQANKRRRG